MTEIDQPAEQPAPASAEPAEYRPADINQSFTPMPEAPADEPETFGSDQTGIDAAAAELTAERGPEELPTTVREYQRDGRHIPLDEFVSAERAADNLRAVRMDEAEAIEAFKHAEVAAEVDAMHATLQEQPAPEPTQFQPQAEQLPEQPAATETKLQRALREDGAFRQEVESLVQNIETQRQQYQTGYEQAVAQTVAVQRAALFADFPDLFGLTDQQLGGALHMMAKSAPEQYRVFMQRANAVQQVAQLDQQNAVARQQQQAQADQSRFTAHARAADAFFDHAIKGESPETFVAVQRALPGVLEKYGLQIEEIKELYASNPIIRSGPVQKILWDITRYHMAMDGVAAAAVRRPASQVFKPGSSADSIPRNDSNYDAASRAFRENPSAKAGAALIAARRGR
jgi:hypothetical protein